MSQASPQEGPSRFPHSWCCAWLLVAMQVVALGWLSVAPRTVLVAAGILVMAAILQATTGGLQRRLHLMAVLACGGLYGALGLTAALHGHTLESLCLVFAQCLLVIQSLELVRIPRDHGHNYTPGLSAITTILLIASLDGEVLPESIEYWVVTLLLLQFLTLRPDLPRLMVGGRVVRGKAAMLLLIVAASLLAGRLFQQELKRDLPPLRRVLGMISTAQDTGPVLAGRKASFVRRVGLNSIAKLQRVSPDELVFNVESGLPPGYMRTLSFSSFDGFSWSLRPNRFRANRRGALVPAQSGTRQLGNVAISGERELFLIREWKDVKREGISIKVPSGTGSLVPLPVDTVGVVAESAESGQIVIDEHGNVVPGSLDNRHYTAIQGRGGASRVSGDYRRWLLRLPTQDAPFLTELAKTIVGAQPDTQLSAEESARRIADYFQASFQYSLEQVAVSDERSPIRRFLEEQHEAHCEYFASASVLLLRALELPARLSTGYLVYEYNDEADAFQATNANAHAWAEVYDEAQQRWILVESTPGIPAYVARMEADPRFGGQGNPFEGQNGLAENQQAGFLWNLLLEFLLEIRYWAVWLLGNRFSWLIPVAIMGLTFGWHSWQSRGRQAPSRESDLSTRTGRRADRLAKRCGYPRAPHETCAQFARRLQAEGISELEALAAWYRAFAEARYTHYSEGDTISGEAKYSSLERQLAELRALTRHVKRFRNKA